MAKYILADYAIKKFQDLANKKMELAESENSEFYRGVAHGYKRAADMIRMMESVNVKEVKVMDEYIDEYEKCWYEGKYVDQYCPCCPHRDECSAGSDDDDD